MSRLQLALNVSDIDAAIGFYSTLFETPPTKVRPGYANFAISDPPLKLVLIETPAVRGTGIAKALNHLGVEVESTGQVAQAAHRLAADRIEVAIENGTTCCYATQDKVWVGDPDGSPWEIYTVIADAPADAGSRRNETSLCCDAERELAETAAVCC